MTCPRASQHADFDHESLGGEDWAHFIRKPTYEQSQRIEIARLAADYQTAGTARMTLALIQTALSGAPAEWRNGYTDTDGTVHEPQLEPTLNQVRFWLDQYETKIETVLLGPETRQKMARATVDYQKTVADVFCVEGSFGAWPTTDGTLAEMVEQKALAAYYRWRSEVNDRLKAAGVDSD